MPAPMLPLAPVTSARLSVRSNIRASSCSGEPANQSIDFVGSADGKRLATFDDPLGKAGQHPPSPELDENPNAGLAEPGDRFAPTDRAGHLANEIPSDGFRIADRPGDDVGN